MTVSRSQPTTDDVELLQQKLEFAEFEWNRATDGMKERDETIAALKARVAELESNEAAYEATLGQRTYNEVAEHIKYLEARDAILDRCSAKVDCICRGEAMKQKDGS